MRPLQLVVETDLETDADNKVVDVEYVADIESVVVATFGGDILAIQILGPSQVEQECIGSIETGIESMAWSPDLEVVIFTTRAQTMLAMTQNWDIIFEQPIHPENEAAQIAARLALAEPSKIKLQTTINDVARVTEAKTQISAQMEQAKEFMPKLSYRGQHTVTWRGDGQFFAVSSQSIGDSASVASEFRVWERSGKFFAKSEAGVLTQSSLLTWKPSGDILASTQSLPTHDEVIFFEKNGLRHYEFKVRANMRVHDLQWNASSDILSVIAKVPQIDSNGSQWALQLWTTRNYHWYLKQERFYADDRIILNWDAENGMTFTITTSSGDVQHFSLAWDNDTSRGTQILNSASPSTAVETNHSLAAVIDGSSLLLTALKYQVIPPPMSALTIRTHSTINQVAFDLANHMMLFHADGSISFYDRYQPEITTGKPPRYNVAPKLIARGKISSENGSSIFPTSCRQISLIGNDELIALCNAPSAQNSSEDFLVHFKFEVSATSDSSGAPSSAVSGIKMHEMFRSAPLAPVFKMFQNCDTGSVYIQLCDMSILFYDISNHELSAKPMMKIPALCPWLSSAIFGDGEEHLIGLASTSFKLFVGDTLMSSECTSFALHSDFLLFTTLTHRLRSITLHKSAHENLAILAPKQNVKFDDSSREVEQGSILVAACPRSTRVVLQMPRGNLEAIEPRSLVLHSVRTLLDQCSYREAFEVMRKQRINLNFAYDHNPSLFMAHISSFLDQVTDVDYLNQFISSLCADDCTKTTYVDVFGHTSARDASRFHSAATIASISTPTPVVNSSPISAATAAAAPAAHGKNQNRYVVPVHTDDAAIKARLVPLKIGKEAASSRSKVNSVCDTLRAEMEKRQMPERYLLPILTTLVCKDPADIESALRMVQALRTKELEETGESKTTNASSSSTSEKALKYLVFLVDVNRLFDIALGMYDFDLVLLVAQKSQKDPREYLPFLAELSKCEPPAYQKYRIDVHLKRWNSALQNIASAVVEKESENGKNEDEIDKISPETKEKLFEFALEVISKQSLFVSALEMFKGEHRKVILDLYGDSLVLAKDYPNAVLAYRTAGKIEKALDAAVTNAQVHVALSLGYQLQLPTKDASTWESKLNSLALACGEMFKWEDAANVLENHLHRPKDALTALISGYLWDNAQMICYRHNLVEKIETEIVPAVLSAQETLLRTIQERTVKISKYHNRLITVRANKYLQAQSESMPMIEGSETSSMYSGASASSASSSNTRTSKFSKGSKSSKASKSSRKSSTSSSRKVSGRKGSPNEEQYLIREIPGLYPQARFLDDVSALLAALFQFNKTEKAVQLQQALDEWISRATKALALINTPSPLTREQQQELDASRMGADDMQLALVNPPAIPHVTFKVSDWRLPLINAAPSNAPLAPTIISPSDV